ncbi:MAG TPA: hypothetical protein VGQ83_36240 [Polyangia bacterium]|jgi:hypothetical protein
MSEQPPSGLPAGQGWPEPGPAADPPGAPPPGGASAPLDGASPPHAGYPYPPAQAAWGYGPGGEPAGYPAYPGAAIHMPGYAAPAPPRSSAAKVLGILGIIFGSLITFGGGLQVGCIALVSSLQVPGAKGPELMRLMQLQMGIWGAMVVMSIALIVIGVGVTRHREVARKAMLAWSVLALALIAGRMATQAFVIVPHSAQIQREAMERQGGPNPNTEQVLKISQAWAIYGDLLVWAPYPILALILLSRARVRDCCS